MIAMALINDPRLLIADEPTTALDVTIQAQILQLLENLQRELGMAVILITHDLGVIAEVADRVLVMYAGRVVEMGSLDEVFYDPQHPYTWGLLGSVPRFDRPATRHLPQIPGQPPSLLHAPRAVTSGPGARTRSTSARRCRGWRGWRAVSTWTAAGSNRAQAGPPRGRRGPDRARGAGRMTTAADEATLLEVRDLVKRSDQVRGAVRPPGRRRAGGRRSLVQRPQRRDPGPGRRVGLRQVDALPGAAAADRAELGLDPLRRHRARRPRPARAAAAAARCR